MRKRGAGILAVVAVLVSATAAFAQEKPQEKSKVVYGLSIPDRVGSLVYRQTIDFESRSPGLGYALRFSGQPGWMIDVYLYDLGLKTIPADAESDVIRNQLAQARGDIFELGKRGTYANLIDKGDFASGTSSASSKLIHGGLRYLEHGDFTLVHEAMEERRRLLRNAPHLVRPLRLVIPFCAGDRVPSWKWRLGLTLYDALAGRAVTS